MSKLTYKDSGVDLEKYRDAMSRLPSLVRRTFSPRVIRNDGGFAGLFQLDFQSPLFARKYDDPVLVSGTDGVGTKLKVAMATGQHDTVGIDLVAMCVNDIICCGAEPLFFLDYVSMPSDNPPLLEQIVTGISNGCVQADCALIGGETAIMPGLYAEGEYDLAGFCVGVVDRKHLIDGRSIQPGNVILGVASNGLHSNGYSLVRKIVYEAAGLANDDYIEALGQTVRDVLLRPTTIYARVLRKVLSHYKVKSVVQGIAHITGGGLEENVERILPEGVRAEFDVSSWQQPPVFAWLQELADVADDEMARTFNMGIGLVLIVSPYYANSIRQMLADSDYESWVIGEIIRK